MAKITIEPEPTIVLDNYRLNGKLKSRLQYIDHDTRKSRAGVIILPNWFLCWGSFMLFAILNTFLASLIVIVFARRPGLYREDCARRSCTKNLGLKCIDNICQCDSFRFYQTGCQPKRSYLQKCLSNSSQCQDVDLLCLDGVCKCVSTSYWSGSSCLPKKTLSRPCATNGECLDNLMLMCDAITKKCSCDSTRFWDGLVCWPKRNVNEKCLMDNNCLSSLNLVCQSGICVCDSNYRYWEQSSCVLKKAANESCTTNENCKPSLNCTSFICTCPNGTYWNNVSSICEIKKTYGQICSSSSECNETKGLSCPATGLECNCPTSSSSRFCDCSNPNYFDYSIMQCVPKVSVDLSCGATYMCQDFYGLECNTGICTCSTTAFWNGTSCVTKKPYGEICSNSSECNSTQGLVCPTTLGICNCPITSSIFFCDCPSRYYYDFSMNLCSPLKLDGISCTADYECDGLRLLECNRTSNTCQCSSTYYWNTNTCDPKTTNGTTCIASYSCQDYLGLSCTSGFCSCLPNYIWAGGECVIKSTGNATFGDPCANTTDCLTQNGLYCSAPVSGSCSCKSGYYFDALLNKCVLQATYGDNCTTSVQCGVASNLTCQTNSCLCPGADWFWSTLSEKCVRCPSGWFVYSGHCYVISGLTDNWSVAEAWCESYGASLLEIKDADEYNVTYSFYLLYGANRNVWVGAKSTANFDFRWSLDNSALSRYSVFWCTGEPGKSDGSGCTSMQVRKIRDFFATIT